MERCNCFPPEFGITVSILTIIIASQPKVSNEEGTHNNQVDVKAGDFEVFEALAMDSGASGTTGKKLLKRFPVQLPVISPFLCFSLLQVTHFCPDIITILFCLSD